jgi:hypothetical protein
MANSRLTLSKHAFVHGIKLLKRRAFNKTEHRNIELEKLFENLERLWQVLGRQPTGKDFIAPLSKCGYKTYVQRFGGYRKALKVFVTAVNDDEQTSRKAPAQDERSIPDHTNPVGHTIQMRNPRAVNWRLRFLTLRRDGFRCRACGRSPANELGVELHVDHILAWSKGGRTEIENLQSLCSRCNGGKSDLNCRESSIDPNHEKPAIRTQ